VFGFNELCAAVGIGCKLLLLPSLDYHLDTVGRAEAMDVLRCELVAGASEAAPCELEATTPPPRFLLPGVVLSATRRNGSVLRGQRRISYPHLSSPQHDVYVTSKEWTAPQSPPAASAADVSQHCFERLALHTVSTVLRVEGLRLSGCSSSSDELVVRCRVVPSMAVMARRTSQSCCQRCVIARGSLISSSMASAVPHVRSGLVELMVNGCRDAETEHIGSLADYVHTVECLLHGVVVAKAYAPIGGAFTPTTDAIPTDPSTKQSPSHGCVVHSVVGDQLGRFHDDALSERMLLQECLLDHCPAFALCTPHDVL
jgi:hypothetical protein